MKKRYYLLQEGEIIQNGDEYYRPGSNTWEPVTDGEPDEDGNYPEAFIGHEFFAEDSKPVRRLLEEQYEHEFSYIVATTTGKDLEDGNNKDSYTVFRDDGRSLFRCLGRI